MAGANPAQGDLEEAYVFDRWLDDTNMAAYYGMTYQEAALGPLPPATGSGGFRFEDIHSRGNVYDPRDYSPCSPGGLVYLTNVVATPATNGTTTVSFTVQGGTNGVFYDLFSTPTLNANLGDYQWTWIGQVLTCNDYTFSNQPDGQDFYVLELPEETMTIAFGGNEKNQCEVPFGLSNAVAVAGGDEFSLALSNGVVIGWGDNAYGQTNIPQGLSNVVGIAAGLCHGVAVLANGSVTNWGYYYDGYSTFCSVTNRTYASAPPTSNVVAVAAGSGQDLALLSNGSLIAWGKYQAEGSSIPIGLNLTNVGAIACGWGFNLALSSNGTITAWGTNSYNVTNVPSDLITNVAAIAAGGLDCLALRKNGTVEGWGNANYGMTNMPPGLSNVVAVATGGELALALEGNGTVVSWGNPSYTNLPVVTEGVKAIATGYWHGLLIESGMLNPVIFVQPTNQYEAIGDTATFSAEGQGVAGVTYQWQCNGTNILGATNATFTLTNVALSNAGNYDVIVSTDIGSITSSTAELILILGPEILSTFPQASDTVWMNVSASLGVNATDPDTNKAPLSYGWQFNGTNIAGAVNSTYSLGNLTPASEGVYSVGVTNIEYSTYVLGSTNLTWNMVLALPGMVEAWGSTNSGECNRPTTLTNVAAISAGEYNSVALTDSGTVAEWGQYLNGPNYYSVTDSAHCTLPPNTSNLVAISASMDHVIALTSSNTVVTWGLTNSAANYVPSNFLNVVAVSAGWSNNVILFSNGTVAAWGNNGYGQNSVPSGLSQVTAIASGAEHTLALSNGKVAAWGNNANGQTNVPAGLTNGSTNVVAIAAGDFHSLALTSNGYVVAWGLNTSGQTSIPAGLSNVMAIAAGASHSVALVNDGTIVAWGNNANGQTNIPIRITNFTVSYTGSPPSPDNAVTNYFSPIVAKLIAAGGNHTMAAIFSSFVQYPVNVANDLLLIYNATNNSQSSNVFAYYTNNRPMVNKANSLGILCVTNEVINPADFSNTVLLPIQNWLSTNPTKRPAYVVLFQDIPSRVELGGTAYPSVQYQLYNTCSPGWFPMVTAINMNGTNGATDCTNYINKLTNFANSYSPSQLFISTTPGIYNNTNWYFDYFGSAYGYNTYADGAASGVTNALPTAAVIGTTGTNAYGGPNSTTQATNVAGYFTGGWDEATGDHNTNDGYVFVDGSVRFLGNSGWYIMDTMDSFNGQRATGQAGFLSWFSANSLGGTNYSNTPVGSVTTVEEPGVQGKVNPSVYYGYWASGKSFAISAWAAQIVGNGSPGLYFQAVGDPFVRK